MFTEEFRTYFNCGRSRGRHVSDETSLTPDVRKFEALRVFLQHAVVSFYCYRLQLFCCLKLPFITKPAARATKAGACLE